MRGERLNRIDSVFFPFYRRCLCTRVLIPSPWLKARTVGICMAFNRLLRFHVVRSTRPCVFIPACFIGQKAYRNPRDPSHMERHPKYPDPHYFLNYTQKYMFRHESLRHLRVEQFNRYLSPSENENAKSAQTAEDTVEDAPEDAPPIDVHHRNYDEFMEGTAAGKVFPSTAQVPGCRRRMNSRLGVSRVPMIEPIGPSREMCGSGPTG